MRKFAPLLTLTALGVVLIVLSGCAGLANQRNFVPVQLPVTNTLTLPFQVQKCLMDEKTGTYYLLEQNRPNLYFYLLGKQINALGGLGTDTSNFRKLTDIALDPDGNLLALDSFALLIRKFDPRGRWIADIDISTFDQPTRFCSTPEGDLIIWDAAAKEFSKISGLDKSVIFTFGRFQVDDVSSLSNSRDYIAAVNRDHSSTLLFSGLGMYIKTYEGDLVVDQFQNKYVYRDRAVRLAEGNALAALGWADNEVSLFAAPHNLLVVQGDNVTTIGPVYGE